MLIVINEANSIRTYKCPFCAYHETRENLVHHVDEQHSDMIPKDYTAARVVYNYFNKREHGNCRTCGKETKWNEQYWRYEAFDTDKCKQKYVVLAKGRMVKRYGKSHLLDDTNHQNKMLANRSISGTYTFSDGGTRSYVGSYEKKLLEFEDKVMNMKSDEIQTPGPTIVYEYNGEKHQWILDQYIPILNLVCDAKDGSDNPNNREMKEYREKQIAKEKAIKEQGEYNYLRLTNNEFDQLLDAMAEIKYSMMNNIENPIIKINEDLLGAALPIPTIDGTSDNNSVYVVPYLKNNTFKGTAITKDRYLNKLITVGVDGKLRGVNKDFLEDCKYNIYEYIGENGIEKYKELLKESIYTDNIFNENCFYKQLTGRECLSEDQIKYDKDFKEIPSIYSMMEFVNNCMMNTLREQYTVNHYLPVTDMKDMIYKESILKEKENLDILLDNNGYFITNNKSCWRSQSYSTIQDIPLNILECI